MSKTFTTVLNEAMPSLRRQAAKLRYNPEDREDLIQRTCEVVWASYQRSSEEQRASLGVSWFIRQLYFVSTSELRTFEWRRKRTVHEVPDMPSPPRSSYALTTNTKKAIMALPRRERALIMMCVVGEASQVDMAEATGLHVTNVARTIRRGLDKLRETMKDAA